MGRNLKINRDVILFAVGAIFGSVASWLCLHSEYERRLKEDIDSVKETFGRLHSKTDISNDEQYTPTQEDVDILKKTIESNGYKDYSHSKEEEEENTMNEPYVISPDEFDELGYRTLSLTYWKDKVVTDTDGNVIEDYDEHIGEDSLEHFGEYEEDSVFVRNDDEETDYEILLDERNYYDVYGDIVYK